MHPTKCGLQRDSLHYSTSIDVPGDQRVQVSPVAAVLKPFTLLLKSCLLAHGGMESMTQLAGGCEAITASVPTMTGDQTFTVPGDRQS